MRTAIRTSSKTCVLGEGPRWHAGRQRAQWVDIDRGLLYEWDPSERVGRAILEVADLLPAALETTDPDQMLLVLRDGLAHASLDGSVLGARRLVEPTVASRLNDASVDPAGRLLVGSLALDSRRGQERLWRLESHGGTTLIDEDLTISNGLGWSPDGATFYSVDSVPGRVWQRGYDPESGSIGPRHLFTTVTDGHPDGLTVDLEGNLWIAVWGTGEVRCFTPDGRHVDTIATTAPLVTSCAFVGSAQSTLLITSADKQFEDIARTTDGGAVFTVDLPLSGRAPTAWAPLPLGSGPLPTTIRSLS